MMEAIPTLRRLPFFAHLPDEALDDLARAGRAEWRSQREVVCREGDDSTSMYVILGGTVRIYRRDETGAQVELSRMETGDFFGELALLDGGPRSASVECLTDCTLFVLSQDAFLQTIETHPYAIRDVVIALARRLRERAEDNFTRQLALQTIRAEAEIERYRSVAQMVAGVAHELNTPLGIASTAAGMIATRMSAPQVAAAFDADRALTVIREDLVEATDLLRRNVIRAHRLVESFKRLAVNQLTDAVEEVDLPQALAEIIDLFTPHARRAGLSIALRDELQGDAGRTWSGYVGHLAQVMMNLLSNIERYAYPDGTGGSVEIVIRETTVGMRPGFSITVADYGAGIEPGDLPRIFDAFFTTGRAKGGTGLGLAIVHNLVTRALRGTIRVDSVRGSGTTVTMVLPRTVAPS